MQERIGQSHLDWYRKTLQSGERSQHSCQSILSCEVSVSFHVCQFCFTVLVERSFSASVSAEQLFWIHRKLLAIEARFRLPDSQVFYLQELCKEWPQGADSINLWFCSESEWPCKIGLLVDGKLLILLCYAGGLHLPKKAEERWHHSHAERMDQRQSRHFPGVHPWRVCTGHRRA